MEDIPYIKSVVTSLLSVNKSQTKAIQTLGEVVEIHALHIALLNAEIAELQAQNEERKKHVNLASLN